MKSRSVTMTAACMLAGGLALSGCQPNNAGGSSASSGASTQGAASGGPGASASSVSAGSGGASSSGGSGDAAAGGVCQAGDLAIALSGTNEVSGATIQWVQLSNSSSSPCTMDGFAGVDLVGSANGQADYSWPLERDGEKYAKFTLSPGEAAYFGIEYLPWASGDGQKIDVTKIELTPPNTTTAVSLPFSAAILLQDAATHPGTFLTPIALGKK